MPRPNILFLMSDQHRADLAGFAGNHVVRTPVLDALAKDAVVFRNAYTASPICVPGRQCLMSGMLPKTAGCEGWIDLPPGANTFARQFARHAYHTVCSGKLHHLGTDQMQGWTKRLSPDAEVSDALVPDRIEGEFARYAKESGTGKWSNQKECERAGIGEGPYQVFDELAVASARQFVRRHFNDAMYDRPEGHRPLLLKLSLLQPHYPFFTDAERFNYYLNRVPLFDEKPCEHPVLSRSQQGKPVSLSARDLRRATAAYYGMVETLDSHFGRLLEMLHQVGQDIDDWIVVYTSDHGEMLGQHGIWEKTRFYEASVRVPLFIRFPRSFGPRVVPQNVSLCDLYATLCDLAGLPIPEGLDSRSLVPLMKGDGAGWNDESVAQMDKNHLMIKRGALKYQYYGEGIPEVLFDLSADPGETRDVVGDPAYALSLSAFRKRRAELGHGPDARPYVNAGYAKL